VSLGGLFGDNLLTAGPAPVARFPHFQWVDAQEYAKGHG
jgi:hypothetical protein